MAAVGHRHAAQGDARAVAHGERGGVEERRRLHVARPRGGRAVVPIDVGDAAAIMMPMTPEAVVIYLGIIWAGGAVVSSADSFAPPEIATRLAIAKTKLVFTCDEFLRSGKAVRLYHRLLTIDN